MKPQEYDDFSQSLIELFRLEAENQTAVLTGCLLELERRPATQAQLQMLLRATHSLKGAARIVNLPAAVHVAHAMEDCFVETQAGRITLGQADIDLLFQGVDLLLQFARKSGGDLAALEAETAADTQQFLGRLQARLSAGAAPGTSGGSTPANADDASSTTPRQLPVPSRRASSPERVLRLTPENLNRLLGLAGESLVESRWLRPFSDSLQRLKRLQADATQSLENLRSDLADLGPAAVNDNHLTDALHTLSDCRQFLTERLEDLDRFDRRSANLSHRLYLEVLRARMRPFGDGVRRFPRMVRDLARSLGKEVRLEIEGENTQVDRDILEQLESPLAHLLRNAVDHGCETAGERERAGKSPEALIRLEAHHSAGMLLVSVTDDGAGIDPKRVRRALIEKSMLSSAAVGRLGDMELLEFLFLPGFSLKSTVTEVSGRGVGLDIVQNLVKSVRGSVRVSTQPGRGTRFQLQLPLTLSVLRTLLVDVGGEPFAIPLSQISHALKLPRAEIKSLEGRHYFTLGNQQVGLLTAHQILDCEPRPSGEDLPVIVLGDRNTRYGIAVDRFIGEHELVVQPLDPRLGKIADISAAALMEDGSPVLIIDVEDLLNSVERLVATGRLARLDHDPFELPQPVRKRILAIDDSAAVRELQQKILSAHGYVADIASNGVEGWNALRRDTYDLVIVDLDMPRMDGLELTSLIRKDARCKSIPIMIVSYKDSQADRERGMLAGANYFLSKGNFENETLLQAVADLIGPPAV